MNDGMDKLIDELRRRGSNESLVKEVAVELVKRFGSIHDALLWLEWVALDNQIQDDVAKQEMTRQILKRAKGPMIEATIAELHFDTISTETV